MKRFEFTWIITLGLMVGGCTNEFTDPDDPKFGNDEEKGILIDLDQKYQTMHHFGASDGWSAEIIGRNWPDSDKEKVGQLLFSKELSDNGDPMGIGLSLWRTNIGSGSANQNNNGFAPNAWHKTTECALQPDGSYDWTQQEGSRWFLKKAKDYGVKYLTGWITSPPYFMTRSGYSFLTPDISGLNLQTDKYNDFANYLGEFVNYHETQGISIDYISLINEPQWSWQYEVGSAPQEGSSCTNQEAADLASAVDEVFTANGIATQLILPESADLEFLYNSKGSNPNNSNQVRSFWNSDQPTYIGGFSSVAPLVAGHSYFSNASVSSGIDHRIQLATALNETGVDFWQTEYSILGGDYLQGGSESDLSEIDYALWMARVIHWDVTLAGATGWSFWTSMSKPQCCDHENRFGLLNWYPDQENRNSSSGEIKESKLLWALGNYSRFVRPGYQRVEIENTLFGSISLASENLMVSGFLSEGGDQLVLVFINYSDGEIAVPILSREDAEVSIKNNLLSTYTTSASSNLSFETAHVESLAIKRKTVVTVVAELNH